MLNRLVQASCMILVCAIVLAAAVRILQAIWIYLGIGLIVAVCIAFLWIRIVRDRWW